MDLSGFNPAPESSLKKIIKNHVTSTSLRTVEMNEERWEMVYELRLLKINHFNENKMITDLKTIKEVEKVSLLAPQLALPV